MFSPDETRMSFDYYRPQGEGNVFSGVCLSTIGLMATLSLLGLVTVWSVCILLEIFLVFSLSIKVNSFSEILQNFCSAPGF